MLSEEATVEFEMSGDFMGLNKEASQIIWNTTIVLVMAELGIALLKGFRQLFKQI